VADQHICVRLAIEEKDILKSVAIDLPSDEIGRRAAIREEPSISAERWIVGDVVTGGRQIAGLVAGEQIGSRRAIEEENVVIGIRVGLSGDEIG
jgi:hypothetical protein